MFRTASLLLASALVLPTIASAFAKDKPKAAKGAPIVASEIAAAGPDFAAQGEYAGEIKAEDNPLKLGVQVIALGDGKFRAVGYMGGLPGDGWDELARIEADGQSKDGAVVFTHENGNMGTIAKDAGGTMVLTVKGPDGTTLGTLKKTLRTSPTLGEKPPAGAIVLFDGTSADAFVNGRVKDGLLLEGPTTKQRFQSYKIHLEFMLPFMPNARGQGRGNSGFYSQGRYETQILDSFGQVPQKDECAAIYGIKAPRINVCYPPLSWQTYDIDYTAAEYKEGKKVKNARLTVRHNGVEVQKDTEMPHATTASPFPEGPEPSPLYFQDHGNPVRFRNIWLVEKK
jgi:hypothetical protein